MLAEATIERPAAPALDKHEGISDPLAFGGCKRWPETMRLLNEMTGELFRGRCKATNLCDYCRTLYTVETLEMLELDAMEYAPTLWFVLTAREHLTRKDTYRHLEQLKKACKKRWSATEWFVQVEFQRRGALHLNLLTKGIPVGQMECSAWESWESSALAPNCGGCLRCVVVNAWCDRVDAKPIGQWVGAVAESVGVIHYISKMLAHGLKAEQAPPIGWKGHRTSQTRGYLVRPASVMRLEAREALREKRRAWKAISAEEEAVGGLASAERVEQRIEQMKAADDAAVWRLVGVAGGRDLDRVRRDEARRPLVRRQERLAAARISGRTTSVVFTVGQKIHRLDRGRIVVRR